METLNEAQDAGLRRTPRGFYSEAVTLKFGFHEALKVQEPPKKVALIWQLRTEKFAPIIPRLIPPLQLKFLAPEQIVVSFDLEDRKIEFPVQAYHPKVQVEYQVSPGCLPRRVQVERKRREYLAQDITKLLTELGVDPCTLIPADDENLDEYNLTTSQHFLPLQIFDNQEFDCRLEEEWLNLGEVQGVRFPVPAEAFIPVKSHSGDSYGWATVAVQSYNKDDREYTVMPLDDSDTTRQLPRIYVMFKAEDPRNFAARIKDALDRRREAENTIRVLTGNPDGKRPSGRSRIRWEGR